VDNAAALVMVVADFNRRLHQHIDIKALLRQTPSAAGCQAESLLGDKMMRENSQYVVIAVCVRIAADARAEKQNLLRTGYLFNNTLDCLCHPAVSIAQLWARPRG